ncbi:ParB N-terminal domain-containing protein [[Clostridium] innocuum]|nr:ParB N-terminal domain-containing protein [[Clostridium] innocuum]MCR0411851.1 ParB N-terminal domain-containing protein [[Clostridium] innocuum]MCR0447038.1 ParB N-terminal domain-containing protein [[Clostridium] innocuum]
MAKKSILGEFMQSSAGKKLGFDNHIMNIHYTKIKRPQRNRELRRIDELAEDIQEDGLENNLLVRKIENDRYEVELIGGERRYSAILRNIEHGDMTYEYIPCKVLTMSDIDARKRLILNNIENDPLTNAEKLEAVEELKEIYKAKKEAGENIPGRIQTIIASEMGLKKSQVANYEKILNHASEEVRESIRKEELPLDAAVTLVDLDEEEQRRFLNEHDTYSKKAVESYKEAKQAEEQPIEKQLYYDEHDEIQEIEIEDVDQRKDTEDEEALESEAWDSITDTPPVETIEDIMTDIFNSMKKLEPKLHGVEFRNEYAQFQKIQQEIDTLMEGLGLVYEEA